MNSADKYKRDYDYQKKNLKRITVWFNTKNKSDMEILNWINAYSDGIGKSEGIKNCIWKCIKAEQDMIDEMRKKNEEKIRIKKS